MVLTYHSRVSLLTNIFPDVNNTDSAKISHTEITWEGQEEVNVKLFRKLLTHSIVNWTIENKIYNNR